MKLYGITLTALSAEEKTSLLDELKRYSFMSPDMIIGSKSGVVEAVVVFWNDNAPFPGGLSVPSCCPFTELPAEYKDAFAANF